MSTIIDGTNGITLPSGAEVVSTTGTQTLTNKSISASQIDSGTMATARLGSGTANSTTFLRGDSTWATVTLPSTDFGGVGSYTIAWFAVTAETFIAAGTTYAGSSLQYAATSLATALGLAVNSLGDFSYVTSATTGTSLGLSGTWRLLTNTRSPAGDTYAPGLFVRVS